MPAWMCVCVLFVLYQSPIKVFHREPVLEIVVVHIVLSDGNHTRAFQAIAGVGGEGNAVIPVNAKIHAVLNRFSL